MCLFLFMEGDPKTTKNGPSLAASKRILMACRWRADSGPTKNMYISNCIFIFFEYPAKKNKKEK